MTETEFMEIDGSLGEGGGQIIRTTISLACIFGIPVRISNIRANRKEPGLRPQHLQAVKSAAELTRSEVDGAQIGSRALQFIPGKPLREVSLRIDTGTAGSTTLIAQTLIPIGLFCNSDFDLEITGGTENPLSPTIDYLQRIVVPFYQELGGIVKIDLVRRGYYPRGGGIIKVRVLGAESHPHTVDLEVSREGSSRIQEANACILSVCRLLPEHVAVRQARSAENELRSNQINSIATETDFGAQAYSPGSSILVYSKNTGRFIGADHLGQKGKRAEEVGKEAAMEFVQELKAQCAVDAHLADMAVTLLSCIEGKSSFTTSRISSHLQTNLHVASALSHSEHKITIEESKYKIELVGKNP